MGAGGPCLAAEAGSEASVSLLLRIFDSALASMTRWWWAGPDRGEGERALYWGGAGALSRLSSPSLLVLLARPATHPESAESRDMWHVTRAEPPALGDQGPTLEYNTRLGKSSKTRRSILGSDCVTMTRLLSDCSHTQKDEDWLL